jgi:GNAT superfamily N-acetyltransferase
VNQSNLLALSVSSVGIGCFARGADGETNPLMEKAPLSQLAHKALALNPPTLFRYKRDAEFVLRDGVAYIRQELPGPGFNWAAAIGVPVTLDQIRRFGDTFFASRDGGWGVLVEADAGHPVESEIRNRGWAIAEDEPAFVMPAMPVPENPPADLMVRRVKNVAGLRAFTETAGAAFGTPADLLEMMMPPEASAVDPDLAYFIGYCSDRPVATAMMYRVGPTACIAGVAVLPDHRRRGFGTAITSAAIAAGTAVGCTSAALRSGPMSMGLYQRMGFLPACVHRTYSVPAT